VREALVLIRTSKSHRERLLPLPQDVGSAIVAYLQKGRPKSHLRNIFLRCRPPFGALKHSTTVSEIVKAHLKRANAYSKPMGAHILRHTAATRMVCGGATFKQVADVLGHQSLGTTNIYAKLNLEGLAGIALPWPGGEQ
jgi:integrase/recombinase XerD